MLETFLSIGVNPENSKTQNEKIRITNFVAMFYGSQGLPIALITFNFIPQLTLIPLIYCLVAGLSYGLTWSGLTTGSRYLLLVFLPLIFLYYTSAISPNDLAYSATFYVSLIPFLLIPFLLFDFSETFHLIIGTIFITILYYGAPHVIDLVDITIDKSVIEKFESGWVSYIIMTSTLITLLGTILYLQYFGYSERVKSDKLLIDSEQRNNTLKQKEIELNSTLEEIKKAHEEDQQRQWLAEGVSKVNELIRISNTRIEKILDTVTSFIVKYVHANQAALFLTEQENGNSYLKQVCVYAWDRKKHFEQRIEFGEGILGQVALEKSIAYLTDVPSDFVKITSGLGDANPRAIAIVPMVINEEVYGILEIATFVKFSPYELEFLNRASVIIATYISSATINEKTHQLLLETQEQSEKMRAQEEELRQNMEELEAVQEEMRRKEIEYLRKIELLEKV